MVIVQLCFLGKLKIIDGSKKLRIPIPAELIVVVLTTLVSYLGDFDARYGLNEAGNVPSGIKAL